MRKGTELRKITAYFEVKAIAKRLNLPVSLSSKRGFHCSLSDCAFCPNNLLIVLL